MSNKQKPDQNLFDALPTIDPSADFTDQVMMQVHAESSAATPSARAGASLWWVTGIAAAACTAIVFFAAFALGGGEADRSAPEWMSFIAQADLVLPRLPDYPLFALGIMAIGLLLLLEQLWQRMTGEGRSVA